MLTGEQATSAVVKNNSRKKKSTLDEKATKNGNTVAPELLDEQESNQVCKLCYREFPLYFYQQEEVIKRLPDRSLSKLL